MWSFGNIIDIWEQKDKKWRWGFCSIRKIFRLEYTKDDWMLGYLLRLVIYKAELFSYIV